MFQVSQIFWACFMVDEVPTKTFDYHEYLFDLFQVFHGINNPNVITYLFSNQDNFQFQDTPQAHQALRFGQDSL